ncbi:hypothetical protein AVEN_64800-1 [Araneus ventricosus]|uniref:Uncharacterized protein n=1 Tax=Araneus ventricosus TaxID=182803 RepID=A0A4Y2GN03_ARAVE|nr:hypothetical protein AVEN_64800-1 [Araneus ventricosus]
MSLPLAPKSAKFLVNQESLQLADLTCTPSSGSQRSSSTSKVQPSSISIVSAIYSCPHTVKGASIQELLQNLRNIINGGTTTTTRGGNSKYKAHMPIDIAAELTKLVETLERRFQTQQDSQPIIPPPAPKVNLTYAEATKKPNTSNTKTLLLYPNKDSD